MSYLSKIKLRNFGVKEDYEVELVNGLIVIRGGNGMGKSTIFTQGILYTFFGIQALDGTVDELSNDQYSSSTMLAEAQYGPFTVKRSKSAATITRSDRKDFQVAGQNEVSQFFRDLFGISKGAEKLILVASQDDLSGILSKGAAETTKFIEQAAGFYQLDEILDRAKDKLKIYNVDQLEEQIETESVRITELEEVIVTNKSLLPGLQKKQVSCTEAVAAVTKAKEEAEAAMAQLKVDLTSIENNNKEYDDTNKSISDAACELMTLKDQLEVLEHNEFSVMSKDAVDQVNSEIEKANELIARRKSYEKFTLVSEQFKALRGIWEGSKEEFQSDLFKLKEQQVIFNDELTVLKSRLAALPDSATSTICTACNREFDNAEELKEHNKKIEEARLELSVATDNKSSKFQEISSVIRSYEEVNKAEKTMVYLGVNDFDRATDTYPGAPVWVGDIPEPVEPTYVSSRLQKLKEDSDTRVAKSKNEEAIVKTRDSKEKAELKLDSLREVFSQMVKLSVEPTEASITETASSVTFGNERLAGANHDLKTVDNEVATVEVTIKSSSSSVDYHTGQVLLLKDRINLSKRNQKYLNVMRKARTSVINTVWKTITDSVSHRFNEITGLNYTLIKEDKYFKCDTGLEKLRPVYRLSGSEQVSLGIAFREVLKMIFSPNCSFLVFDEPFASMSQERTASAMAAISNMVGQVLVITHEESSELAAQQLIEVE